MSADPEAIIYYGFPLPDFNDNEDEDDDDYDGYEMSQIWEDAKKPKEPSDKSNYRTPEWDDWRKLYADWQKSPENIRVSWSGASECEAYYVHAVGLTVSVEWDDQQSLKGFDFGARPDADRFLREFCERFEIPWQEPGWYLAARYF